MKKILLVLSTVALVAFTSCKKNASDKIEEANVTAAAERDANATKFPKIEFNKTEHDFGEITKGTAVETTFTYKNTGNAPLVITNIKSSCGCTVPQDWSKEPLAPGETGKFTVNYNGAGPNKITKTITVSANTESGSEVVKITAFVKDPNAATNMNPAANAVN
ncbi:DUF1573 domain-containing protein [Mariniflexile sp.]|uniref:DUF1573 domain-containing protein n=1 Tax=Mariniflexile sp. TaxID=1979402 RepID=UPI0035666F7C